MKKQDFIITSMIFFCILMTWCWAIPGTYHFDDFITPLSDPASQSIRSFFEHLGRTLRPFTKLTYAVEASFGLTTADARRVFNLLLHGMTGVLFFRFLTLILPSRNPFTAAVFTLLYALHPVHAETVLAVAGRSALLANLLLIASWLLMLTDRPKTSLFFFFLAVFSRETALAGIIVLLPLWKRHFLKLGFLAGVTLFLLLSIPRYRELAAYSFAGRPFAESLVQQISAIPVGLLLYLKTSSLTLDHGEPLLTNFWQPFFWIGIGILFLASAMTIQAIRRSQNCMLPGIGAAIWLAAICPTQTLIPKLDALSERPLSLAWAGIVLLLYWAYVNAGTRFFPSKRGINLALGLILTFILAFVSSQRAFLYRSELLLWRDAAQKSHASGRALMNYATALIETGQLKEARQELIQAEQLLPFDPDIRRKLWLLDIKLESER